jgi:hypothetical protein
MGRRRFIFFFPKNPGKMRCKNMNESLRVEYLSSLSPEEVDAVKNAFDSLSERPSYRERLAPEMVASTEWALPAALSVFVLLPFAQGFFKVVGEKAYNAIVTATKSLKHYRHSWHDSSRTLYSPITRISTQTNDGLIIDAVFPVSAGEATEASLKKALEDIESVFKEVHELRGRYSAFQSCKYFLYGYDPLTEKWEPNQGQKLILKRAQRVEEMMKRQAEAGSDSFLATESENAYLHQRKDHCLIPDRWRLTPRMTIAERQQLPPGAFEVVRRRDLADWASKRSGGVFRRQAKTKSMALVNHPWTLLDIAGRRQGFDSPRLQVVGTS